MIEVNNKKYYPIIGLEIHAELNTKSKMFCSCKNDPHHGKENEYVCPICMGHPGTLPVPNIEAIKSVLKVGIALNSILADFTEFDRKNYFYPDIPKAYQLSQYAYPLVSGGFLPIKVGDIEKKVKITRIHIEEDTAKSSHSAGDYSLVDFNRSGVPLMELVTEPVITSGIDARIFAEELQLLLRTLGVSEANMDKGEMRVEVNVSVGVEEGKFGTKVEVKNLNSFKSAERSIDYEIKRHIEMIESGEKIKQETRGFDDVSGKTISQRSKEDAKDYRYFPDPDIPKYLLSKIESCSKESLSKDLSELPWDKRARYKKDFGIKENDTDFLVININTGFYFEEVLKNLNNKNKESYQLVANYIISDLAGNLKKKDIDINEYLKSNKIVPENFAILINMIGKGELSSRGAKDTLLVMIEEGGNPREIAEEKSFIISNDPSVFIAIIDKILANNGTQVVDYKAGKVAMLQYFIGQAMKEAKGKGSPEVFKKLLEEKLKT